MDVYFSTYDVAAYLLALFRSAGILFMAPIFGGKAIPVTVKASISIWLGFVFLPYVEKSALPDLSSSVELSLSLAGELLIGIMIGTLLQVIVAIVSFGGHIIGMHMGIRIANVFDPIANHSASVISAFLNAIVVLMLLAMDYHHLLLNYIAASFEQIQPLRANFSIEIFYNIVMFIGHTIYNYAIRLVAPVLLPLFFMEVIMAVLAKVASKMNVMMLQFPIKIFAGLMFLVVLIRAIPEFLQYFLREVLNPQILLLLEALGS